MIYVLGSINMDLVSYPPYMPKKGETLSADKFIINQGGKGANQAVAIAKLGGKVCMIGKVGKDSFGKELISSLKKMGVDTTNVSYSKKSNSGLAQIIVLRGDNRIIISKGANYDITTHDVDKGLQNAKSGDILLMQLEIPLDIVLYGAKLAKEKGMIVVLNPAPAVHLPDNLLQNVDMIAPNETETKILTDIDPVDEVHIALVVKHFYSKGLKNVIITLGSKGAYVSFGMEITHIPPRKVKVVDTTGAGDTFIGALMVGLDKGQDIVSASKMASVASSITITREGASSSIPTMDEVEKVLQNK